MLLKEGQPAAQFILEDQNGIPRSLASYRGRWVALYFYPKDDTPGCTKEACAFRDGYIELLKAGAVVLGISSDGVKSHKKFAEKYMLPFPLLADLARQAIDAYGVGSIFGARRVSFLIDPNGMIAKVYDQVHPAGHAGEVIVDLRMFQMEMAIPQR